MKKKILYFFVITLILLSPIFYWFNTWWGVTFSNLPSIERLRYIYSQDQTLLITTSINIALYIFAITRIFFIKHTDKKEIKDENKEVVQANVQTQDHPFVENVQINPEVHHDNHWKNMYDNPSNVTEQPVNQNQTDVAVNNIAQPQQPQQQPQAQQIPQPQTQVSEMVQPQQVDVSNNVQNTPDNNTQNNNVIDMKPITADDVFKIQVQNVLKETGYHNMGDQNINGYKIDFLSIADSDTLIVGIINSQYGDIIANETSTDNSLAPSWFTNEHKYNSPVWEVKNASVEIDKMIKEVLPEDSEIDIKPIVVIPNANVSNYNDIKSKWDEIGVDVVRFLNQSELPNLTDVIPDKKETEVLKSYKTFIETLMKYFQKKAIKTPIKKTG